MLIRKALGDNTFEVRTEISEYPKTNLFFTKTFTKILHSKTSKNLSIFYNKFHRQYVILSFDFSFLNPKSS